MTKFTKREQAQIDDLKKILTPEQMDDIEEQVANEKATQRYRELLERSSSY